MSGRKERALCKGTGKTRRGVLGALDEIFEHLIKKNRLEAHKDKIRKMTAVLFDGFAPGWLSNNQKFDFSFTSERDGGGLRFSYNNFGEKTAPRKKFLKVFGLFPDAFDLKALGLFFDCMGKAGDRHQTTIGCAWRQDAPFPRLKIYFEELYHYYTQEEIRDRWRCIAALAGVPASRARLLLREEVGALAVDFVPFGPYEMKVYYLRPRMDTAGVRAFWGTGALGKRDRLFEAFQKRFLGGDRAFFYVTHRLSREGRPLSFKLYKIFEVCGVSCPESPLDSIKDFFRVGRLRSLEEYLEIVETIAAKKGICVYPVIIACDKDRERSRVDLYVSLK